MRIDKCRTRAFATYVIAGVVAAGPAALAETDWDALSGAAWHAEPAEAAKVADTTTAPGAASGSDWSAAIRKAFVDLGMADARAECYGRVLANALSPEDQQAAAKLVGDAETAGDVKLGVIAGGPEMVGGFSAADATCPESLGG